jgi:hypothetical protein
MSTTVVVERGYGVDTGSVVATSGSVAVVVLVVVVVVVVVVVASTMR